MMNVLAIVFIVYAALVIVLAVLKPAAIWKMKKIQFFEKHLGAKGTEIFFYVWALIFLVIGVWMLTK